MEQPAAIAEVNIHLRARAADRDLIDQAAELAGMNRSQFMLSSAVKNARNLLLDQTAIQVDKAAFNRIMSWLEGEPSAAETAGMKRLLKRKQAWVGE